MRYESWYTSLPSSLKQQREMANSACFEESGTLQLNFVILFGSKHCLHLLLELVFMHIDTLNTLQLLQDPYIKYKFIFQ